MAWRPFCLPVLSESSTRLHVQGALRGTRAIGADFLEEVAVLVLDLKKIVGQELDRWREMSVLSASGLGEGCETMEQGGGGPSLTLFSLWREPNGCLLVNDRSCPQFF